MATTPSALFLGDTDDVEVGKDSSVRLQRTASIDHFVQASVGDAYSPYSAGDADFDDGLPSLADAVSDSVQSTEGKEAPFARRHDPGQYAADDIRETAMHVSSDTLDNPVGFSYTGRTEIDTKTDFFRYAFDRDVQEWPQVESEAQAAHLLSAAAERVSDPTLSVAKGVKRTENTDGTFVYHLSQRLEPTVRLEFSSRRAFVTHVVTCVKTWLSKSSVIKSVRYLPLLSEAAFETTFWSTLSEQGRRLLDTVACRPEQLTAVLHDVPAVTGESDLPDASACGLYLLVGLPAHAACPRLYVGQSICFRRRWKQHFFQLRNCLPGAKDPVLVYQELKQVRAGGGRVVALPLHSLSKEQHRKWACLLEIVWTMIFRSFQGSPSFLAYGAASGLPQLHIVGLNCDHGGGREYGFGSTLTGLNPTLDDFVWDLRYLHSELLMAQSVALLAQRFTPSERHYARQCAVQLRTALEAKKRDFSAEKGRLLCEDNLFLQFRYYNAPVGQWICLTFFELHVSRTTLLGIFSHEELAAALPAGFVIVRAGLRDALQPALESDFLVMTTDRQRAGVGGISITISHPATGQRVAWQQKLGLAQSARLCRAYEFLTRVASTSTWRSEQHQRIQRTSRPALAALQGVAKKLWEGEQGAKRDSSTWLLSEVHPGNVSAAGWSLPKDPVLNNVDVVGHGIFLQIVLDSDYPLFRGRLPRNDDEELAIACIGLRFLSFQSGWMALEQAYTTGGSCVFEQCMTVWRLWFPRQSDETKLRLQRRLPRGAVPDDEAQDGAEEPSLFRSFRSSCAVQNRLSVPGHRFVDKKLRHFTVPAGLAATFGHRDGHLPSRSKWMVKIDAWGKEQDEARILVKRVTPGRHAGIWFDLEEYRVQHARNPYCIPHKVWEQCAQANEAHPRPSSSP